MDNTFLQLMELIRTYVAQLSRAESRILEVEAENSDLRSQLEASSPNDVSEPKAGCA